MACYDATNMIYTVFSGYIRQYIENGTRFFVSFAIYWTNFFGNPSNIYRAHKKNATRQAWVNHSGNVPELLAGLQILSLQDMESYYSFHPLLLS